jgi:hypothetical protein
MFGRNRKRSKMANCAQCNKHVKRHSPVAAAELLDQLTLVLSYQKFDGSNLLIGKYKK